MQNAVFFIFCFALCTLQEAIPPASAARSAEVMQADSPDTSWIGQLHQQVFAPRCGQAGCHDGMFEPDFRTVQSTYNTLVYYPVFKNNLTHSFKYRVVPYDTSASLLWERITNCCFVNTDDRMPQDNPAQPLNSHELSLVKQWILSGAPDAFNIPASLPDRQPYISNCDVYGADRSTKYSDTRLRGINGNPMVLPKSEEKFWIVVQVTDDHVPARFLKTGILTVLSDFENYQKPLYAVNKPHLTTDSTLLFTIPVKDLPLNDTLFLHVNVNDGAHDADSQYPHKGINRYDMYRWSFIVQ